MAWFKVDDRLHSSRKVLSIPRSVRLSAVGLWVLAGSWSAHEELDGYVPDYMVTELGGTPRIVEALTTAGLWLSVDVGSQFNKWNEYQPTRAELEAARAKETERKRAYRARGTKEGVPVGQTEGHQRESGHPDPTRPDPTPTTSNEVVKTPAAKASRGSRIPEPFMVTRDMREWAAEEVPTVNVEATTCSFVDYWRGRAGAGATKVDWPATWRNSMRAEAKRDQGSKPTKTERAAGVIEMARQLGAEQKGIAS